MKKPGRWKRSRDLFLQALSLRWSSSSGRGQDYKLQNMTIRRER